MLLAVGVLPQAAKAKATKPKPTPFVQTACIVTR